MNPDQESLRRLQSASTTVALSIALACSLGVQAARADIEVGSSFGTPTIDGRISVGEWDLAEHVEFAYGIVSFRNDHIRLYVLIDAIGDTGADPPVRFTGDVIDVSFDHDENAVIDDRDLSYRLYDAAYNLGYQYYVAPGLLGPRAARTRSSVAAGFDCFVADSTRGLGGSVCNTHRVWEIAFDLEEIFAEPGSVARLGIEVESESPAFEERLPPGDFRTDFSNLLAVRLEEEPAALPVASSSVAIRFDEMSPIESIEVTQAIQDRQNSLPLVADKATVARMYLEAQPGGMLIALLYGTRDGDDLPGSPLASLHYARESIDRELLDDTVNFALPDSWTQGRVEMRGLALPYDSYAPEVESSPVAVSFAEKEEAPIIWIVRVNGGSEEAPLLGSRAELEAQRDFLQTVYPTPHARLRTLPWQSIGAQNSDDYGDFAHPLGELWLGAFLGAALSGGWDDMPDFIYGFAPACDEDGCGVALRDPGAVAMGHTYSCIFDQTGELATACDHAVFAHESNHMLDRTRPFTWGQHVTNPDLDDDSRWGCGAAQPDPDWAALWDDDEIREIGFDTRPPWQDGWGRLMPNRYNHFTVVPSEFPDFLSYCRASVRVPVGSYTQSLAVNPVRWISGYRWLRLFCELPSPPGTPPHVACANSTILAPSLLQRLRLGLAQTQPVFYVTATLGLQGGGVLHPVVAQQGASDMLAANGEYAVELQDASGNALLVAPFTPSFVDANGDALGSVPVTLQLPALQMTRRIVLRRGPVPLDTIEASDSPPEVSIVEPKPGEQWMQGSQRIRWSASDPDGDPLTFSILYSPDQGQSWHPVAWAVEGGEFEVDTAALPGGNGGRVRVVATDGFHTVASESAGSFYVAGTAPDAAITLPKAGAEFVAGQAIELEGRAHDAEQGTLPDEAFEWRLGSHPLAVGPSARVHLPPGVYTIVLSVGDAEGMWTTDAVEIAVAADGDGDGVGDLADLCPETPDPRQLDSDDDGIGDSCDLCAATEIPERAPTRWLGIHHYALVDDDGVFDSHPWTWHWWWWWQPREYTLEDTRGCSCEQIITGLQLGPRHLRYGCGTGVMDYFTWIVSPPPSNP